MTMARPGLLPTRLLLLLALCAGFGWAAPLRVNGASIVDASGATVELKGFNHFGFNNGATMVDGLWGSDALSADFATVVQRQKLLGFNAVRLPFSFKDLAASPRSFTVDYCQLPTPEQVAASVTPPGQTPPGPAPALPAPPPRQPNKCNDYLPSSSTMDRFVWVVNFYANNGFYVLVDNHLREDQSAINDPAGWARAWADLATRLTADPVTRSRLMIDILNEPDNFGVRWEKSGSNPALKDLYLSAMDAIETAAPGVMFFVEGTGQGGLNTNWGDGFATDPVEIANRGLSDPRPFFTALLGKPYRDRTVLSPHVSRPAGISHAALSAATLPPSPTTSLVHALIFSFPFFLPFPSCADLPPYRDQQLCQRLRPWPRLPPVHLLWHQDELRVLQPLLPVRLPALRRGGGRGGLPHDRRRGHHVPA